MTATRLPGSHPAAAWLHILGFAVITVIIIYIVLDIEYPRAGLIRLQAADHVQVELRRGMK